MRPRASRSDGQTELRADRRRFLGACAAGLAAARSAPPCGAAAQEVKAMPTCPLAMWALTGTLKSDDIHRHLDAFAAAGWGVVLYPRWGLEIEYLSDVWFDRIRYIVDQAAARSMEVWLYDEFCWPSGHAKGLVTRDHPELAAQILCVEPDGRTRVELLPQNANLLLPAATRRFLEVTHERYAAAIGQHFGRAVRAIFTDEPSLDLQHAPRNPGETCWRFMWSAAMRPFLGDDFPRRLEAEGTGVAQSPLWRDYWAALARAYHDAWTQPIADWCRAHHIALTGHLLGENDFGSHVSHYGSLRRQLNAFQLPGIDEIHTRYEVGQCEAMTLAAIAEYPGRERMCEVFALGPCHMPLQTMRKMVDLCAACGVDRYVMAIAPLDLRGNYFNRRYLSVLGPQQPWFRDHARTFADYLAEAATRARKASPLGVRWPSEEELWAAAGPSPRQSAVLKRWTAAFLDQAREAIRARLPGPPAYRAPRRVKIAANWTFEPAGLNSVRIDGPTLIVVDLPSAAELSVQRQLVRGLRINDTPVDLAAARPDAQFDVSYVRVPVTTLLRRGENAFSVQTDETGALPFLPGLILWGDFSVDGKQRIIAPARSIALGDWRSQGYPAFCGVGRYRATVEWPTPPSCLGLDTGGYPVSLVVNGRLCGRRAWEPLAFDLRGAARGGRNEIVVEVASTIGHLFLPASAPPVGLLDAWICT